MFPYCRSISSDFQIGRADGMTWVQLKEYVPSLTIELGSIEGVGTGSSGTDGVARQLSFSLKNSTDGNFAPQDRDSPWNRFNDSYVPLIWPGREVSVRSAVTSPGVVPVENDWLTVFRGVLGDSIKPDPDNGLVSCQCRDLSKLLQDNYIKTTRTYGSTSGVPAEIVIQQILDHNLGSGIVTLYCPVPTAFMVTPYEVEYQSVWDAIQQVVVQFGWWLGYKWNTITQEFRLTLLEPPRNKTTVDYIFNYMDDIYVEELEISDKDIRNDITVVYTNKATGKRENVNVFDQASINEYGRKAMTIEEKDASLIDTPDEALAMANAALHDLKDIIGTVRIVIPYCPQMDIFSTLTLENPKVSSTVDFYAVQSIRHNLNWQNGDFTTEIIASGKVVGAHTRWLQMETRPGSPGRVLPLPTSSADVPNVSDIVLDEDTYRLKDGTILSDIIVNFSEPDYKYIRYFNIYYDIAESGTWRLAGIAYQSGYKIKALPNLTTIKVKITTLSLYNQESLGVVSSVYNITGKDSPPANISKFNIIQNGAILKVVITPNNEPDTRNYELRRGANWETSVLVKTFIENTTTFTATEEGTQTYWIKAVDNSGNYSVDATKANINVSGLPVQNIIKSQNENLKDWLPTHMYYDYWGHWQIASQETIGSMVNFADIFECTVTLYEDAQLELPVIDTGPNVFAEGYYYIDPWGNIQLFSTKTINDYTFFFDMFDDPVVLVTPKYKVETFLGVNVTYFQNENNYINVEYATSFDNLNWSDWIPIINNQFFGRYVKPRLLPVSLNHHTNVDISAAFTKVDVPDLEEYIENVNIPTGVARIAFARNFFDKPKSIACWVSDTSGKMAIWRINPDFVTINGFQIEILDDNGNLMAGKLIRATIRGY
jgi:hypothetical protein